MFTGIVEELGTVAAAEPAGDGLALSISAGPAAAANLGDSVAVDGVCLTVAAVGPGWFRADVVAETCRRTTLRDRRPGDRVNLERPLALADRLGGHLVQGHVDGTAAVAGREDRSGGTVLTIGLPVELDRYVVAKGSVAVDGVSLTVAGLNPGEFTVALIPTTLAATTLGARRPGDLVNLEVDVLAKYVERLLAHRPEVASRRTGR